MKKIVVLTSGGDSSGINACLLWIIKASKVYNIKTYFAIGGLKGLYENNIVEADYESIKDSYYNGGTKIYTSRFIEFKDEKNLNVVIENLKKFEFDAVVILGGNGSLKAAKLLSFHGIRVIGIPASIDNNIINVGYSIGFNNAVEVVASAIKNMKETAESHNRCYIVETMGDDCGKLTKLSAIASNADLYSIPESLLTIEQIISKIKWFQSENRRGVVIVITEKMYRDYEYLIKKINSETNYFTRFYSISFIQRAGSPNALERYNAAVLGCTSIKFIANYSESGIISLENNSEVWAISFDNNVDNLKITLGDEEFQNIITM